MKTTLLLVDTDEGFEQSVRRSLAAEGLSDDFLVRRVSPQVGLQPDKLAQEVLIEVSRFVGSESIGAIFVDLVVREDGADGLDDAGLGVAAAIKRCFAELPVYVVTSKVNSIVETDQFSAATLERDVDGVLVKTFLVGKGFSTARLKKLLRRSDSTRRTPHRPEAGAGWSGDYREVASRFDNGGSSTRLTERIEALGVSDFWRLLGRLLPDGHGVLTDLSQGRSGAGVFRVTAKAMPGARPLQWLLKVSREQPSLRREVENYKKVIRRLEPHMYPHLLEREMVCSGGLCGIAFEMRKDAVDLAQRLAGSSEERANRVASSVGSTLLALWGDRQTRLCSVWRAILPSDRRLGDVAGALDELQPLLATRGQKAAVESLRRAFIQGDLRDVEWSEELDVRFIHGDLNAGNVLMQGDKCCLIDFSESREEAAVALDVAKLLRDSVLRAADRHTRREHDWSHLEDWRSLARAIWRTGTPESVATRHTPLLRFASDLGVLLSSRAGIALTSKPMRAAAAWSFLTATANDNLSLPKRAFAALTSADLLASCK